MKPVEMVALADTSLLGVLEYFGTENANDEPSVEYDQRAQRCYELAGYALAFGSAPRGATVIHGSWHGPRAAARIGHAWLKFRSEDGQLLVWEPITAAVYDGTEFYKATRARDEREYAETVVRQMLHGHGHYGRWHESRYP